MNRTIYAVLTKIVEQCVLNWKWCSNKESELIQRLQYVLTFNASDPLNYGLLTSETFYISILSENESILVSVCKMATPPNLDKRKESGVARQLKINGYKEDNTI